MKKRLLSTLLALCMVLSLLPGTAWAAATSGKCGDNLTWSYSNGTLSIEGTGRMDDYFTLERPWLKYREQIHTIIIGNGVTSIGALAFWYCNNLSNVTISNSVTTIRENAFDQCNSLSSVTIPASVTDIEGYAFAGCSGLASINVASGNPAYISVGGILFNTNQTLLHTYPAGKMDSSSNIPASVTFIGDGAFAGCNNLTSVTIPNSVTDIGHGAFTNCKNLTRITIPDSVTYIKWHTFYGCSRLTDVNYYL